MPPRFSFNIDLTSSVNEPLAKKKLREQSKIFYFFILLKPHASNYGLNMAISTFFFLGPLKYGEFRPFFPPRTPF